MALPNESKLEQESKKLGGVDINPSVRSDNFVFQPSDSWLDTPMTEEFTKGLNPDYVSQIDRYSAVINPYAPSSLANFNTPVPGQSVGQYNPVAQQTPPDMSTPEGAIRSLELAANKSYTKEQLADVKPVIADPIYSSSKATQFDRYYNHPKFAELGFHPYAKNEEYYNANSSIYEDMSRMFGQMGQLTGSGFISTYRSIGDLFDSNDNYISQPDLETATEFEDAMAIGMSTREGFGGFANNQLLNTGYTLGIIGSIAVEELALAGLTYASGGFAGTAAAAGTAANLKRLGQVISNSFQLPKLAKATRNMLKGLDKVDNSRTFWQATKSGDWGIMGTLFAPETMAAVKNFNSGKNAAQNLTNFAKAQNVFGGFYRDLRSVNYALAESKLEGGLTFNQQIKNGMAIEQAKDPLNPNITPEQMADIVEKAERASFSTTIMNAPFIYLSNKLVLDNALGGFNKSLGRLMNDKITGIGRKLVQTKKTLKADGEIAQDVFEYAGDGLKGFTKTLKAAGVKGSLKMGLGASARYFAANLAEGIQEVGQEAISYGTKQYYSNLQNDPLLGGLDITNAAISSAVDSQFSGQGFETFMSGFLTGGLVAGPQKLVFQTMPNLYTRLATPEKFQKYKAEKEAFYDSIVKTHNKAWNEMAADPNAIFDPNRLNFLVQKEVAAEMKKSAYESDMFGFTDAKDFGKFQQMYTIMQNGTSNLFRSQLNDFLNLTDEELIQAFPVSKQEVKSGKLRARVQDMLIQIDKTEDAYNKNKDRFENPFDASQFKKGTREYNEEALKQVAYDHASYLYMFTEDGFNRALERSDNIYNELASDPILAEIAANDITVLLDQDSIDNEVKILLTEIAVLEDTKENKKLKKQKLDKLTRLQNINSILTDKTNLTNKGVFDQRKVGKLTKAFESYVQHLADTKNSFVDRGRIQEVLKKIVDYKALKGRAKVYDKAIQYLSDPNKFNEVFKRQSEINKEIFKKNRTDIRKRVEKYVSKNEANQLLNDLFTLDVFPDAAQAERFLQTGNSDFLKSFYNENGIIDPTFDKELYAQIQDMLDKYKDLTKIDTVEETEEQKEEVAEVKKSTDKIDKVLYDAEIEAAPSPTFGSDESVNPVIKTLLDKLYKTYRRDQLALGKKALGQKEWLNSKEAQLANKGYEAIKQLWYQSIKEDFKSPSELNKAYKTDNGFINWLTSQETNPDVRDILQEANLSFSDFYKVESTEDIADDIDVEYSGKVIASGPAYVVLEQTTIGDDGAVNKFYQIKTKDNKDISEDILKVADISEGAVFSNIDKAIKKQKELEELFPSDSTFEFDGVELYNGAEVIDGDGNKFVVTSSKNSLNKYKNLSIIPSDKINLKGEERKQATIILKPGQFKNSYKIEKLNFNILPSNVTRLRIDEPVRPFVYQNGRGTANQETREQASKRYDAIMETLTPEEIDNLEFIVSVNPAAGNIIKKELKYEDKESNPFIKRVSDSYIIGIRIVDAGVQAKVNAALKAKDINPTDSADGIFAYMPNNGVKIFNNKKEEIDPRNIDQETANNTFFRSSKSATNPLQSIRNNFAVQANFIQSIENKLGNKDSVTIPLYELAEEAFTFSLRGEFNQDTPPKSLTDLAYNTVDGSYIIYDNRKFTRKDENGKIIVTRRSDTKTNIEDVDEETKIIAQVKQDLENKGMYNLARNMGAYVAIIKSPNGEYTLAELKATSMQDSEINDFVKSLVDRAVKTREENLDDPALPSKANRKNLGYNVDFNNDISKKVFISTNKGYSIDISVDPGGRIEFNIYDKQTRQKLFVHTSGKYKGKSNPIVINQTDIESVNASKNYLKSLDAVIKLFNENDIAKKLGIKLERSSFRKSFSEGVNAQEIVDSTTTTLDDRVRYNYKLKLKQDSSYRQASRNVPSSTKELSKKTEQEKDDTQTLEEEVAKISAAGEPIQQTNEVEDKKADIEKRRQEELDKTLVGQKVLVGNLINRAPTEGIIKEIKLFSRQGFKPELGFFASNIGNDVFSNITKTSELYSKIQEINAKYDAELASLSQPTQTSEVIGSPEVNFEVEKQNLKDAIDARELEIIKTTERKDTKDALDNDKTLNDLNNKLRGLQANKIISPNLSITDVEDINVFKSWAASALPDFISIDDITTLGNNMKAGGVRVGAFVLDVNDLAENIKVKGTIYTGASSPYRYHEAFHGVFRMLLTDAEIEKYLGLARREVREKLRKEGKDFKTELQKFRNSADTYTNMSEKRLIEEYYEEYLADQFEIFKKSPKQSTTSSENKSFFTRVIEWIKAVLGNFTRNELTDLYKNIDAGKYKSASTVINRFTDAVVQGITIEANVLIPTKEFEANDKKAFEYLDPDAADAMVRSMAAIYISREEKNTNTSITRNDLLTKVIKDFKQLYDITSDANINLSDGQIRSMLEYDRAFENYEKEIINSVTKFLSLVDISFEDPIYVAELKEDSEGLRNVDDWDKDASLIGGFSSLSAKLRRYIMTTSVEERDMFDHEELTPGEKLIVPVDFNEAYNGMLKAVKNTTDANKILQQIYLFGQNNPQTNAVATRIFNDLGITEEDIANNTLENGVKNPLFFNALIKGLENFRVDYLFIHRNVDGRIVTYSASSRDDASSQIDRWGQAFLTIFNNKLTIDDTFNKEAREFLSVFKRQLEKKPKSISDIELAEKSKKYADGFRKYLGISLSRQYIAYHIIDLTENLTLNQKLIKENNKDIYLIKPNDISEIRESINNTVTTEDGQQEEPRKPLNIFSREKGMTSKLIKISFANAPFDETVGASVFKNAKGNLVNAHQKPTFHLKKMAALNDPSKIEELINDEYLKNNLLLNSPFFQELARQKRLGITRISGEKKGNINITDEGLEESRSEGKDYGDFTAKDFITTLLNSYTDSFNSSTGKLDATVSIEDADGNIIEEALSPVLIRVIEASNTGDMAKLPVIKAVKLGSKGSIELTDEALDGYLNSIKAEFERIKRESNEETKTSRKIADYNDGEKRALKFNQNSSLLSPGKLIDTYTKSVKFVTSDAQLSRVREGNQKALFYNKDVATKIIKFTDTNEVRQALIQEKGKPGNKAVLPVKNLGLVTVTNLNREEIFTLLGEAVSNEKTKIAKYPVKIGEATFYTESNDLRKFLKGQMPMYIYTLGNEVVDTSAIESTQPTQQTSEVEAEIKRLEAERDKELLANNKLKFQDLKTKVSNKFGTLQDSKAELLEEYKGNEVIEFMINNLYDVNPGSNAYVDLDEWSPSEISKLNLKSNKLEEAVIFNFPELTKKEITNILSPVSESIFLDHKGALLSESEGLSGLPDNLSELNAEKIITKYEKLIAKAKQQQTNEVEVDQEPVIVSTDSRNWKEDIEKEIAKDPTLSFDEVIDSLGGMKIFEEFLRNRLELEFQNFNKKLNSISTDADLSNYIRFGLTNKFGDNTGVVAKSNNQLNLTDNKEYNLRQIFHSNRLNTRAINQILLGDTAMSLKGAVDAVKRAKMQNAAYDSAASIIKAEYIIDPKTKKRIKLGIEHPLQQMNLFAFTEPQADATFNEGNKTDYADAQMWMTTKAFRYMWFGFGKLSASQAVLLNKVDAGEDISYEELLGNADKSNESYAKIKAMLNSKKLVYGDGQTFVKMSAFTLTKQYTSRQDENGNWVAKENKVELHNLRERMEKFEAEQWSKGIGTIAMAAPVSALKMMKENVQDINEALSTDVAFTEDQSMQLDANFMGLQTITPSNKLIVTDATQIKTIVTSEQKDDTEVIIDGEPTTIGAIRKSYNGAIKQRISLKYVNRRNLLFDFDIEYAMDLLKESVKEGDIKPDLYVYLNYAQAGLEASNATSNILEMFSLDENGEQKYNLNNPQTVKKFEQLFLSFFSKGVLSEKTTGMSMTLVSDLGVRVYRRVLSVDENGMPDRQEVIREDVWDRMTDKPEILFNIDDGASKAADSNLSGLAAAVEGAGSEGVVILDRLRSNLKDYDSKGEWTRQRYSEMIIPPHHTEVGDLIADTDKAIPEAVAKMFGVRIPSQDNHSAVNLKAVDFMPGFYGSSAVFARELIEISGADFDIDKLYIQSKDFYVKDGEFIEYGKADTEDGQYMDYIRAMNANIKQAGSSLNQALLKYNNSGGLRSLSDTEIDMAIDAGFEENTRKALMATGLPISFDEYVEYKEKHKAEPYSEAINNKIVDYKFALIGNEHVTNTPGREVAISHEPADTKVLENLLEDLAEDIPYFQNLLDNEEIDVDNLLGQVLSFAANKEGAKSIGSVVLPNLYLNLLQEYKAKVGSEKLGAQKTTINLKLNDLNYNDFGITESSDSNRTQYVLSALITAMTDNAKLRLSSKLGLNKDALAVVANMTALGVPIKTSILLVNHPTIRELYFKAINKDQPMDPGIDKLVKDRIKLLEKAFGDLESVSVMDALLSSEIDDNLLGIDENNIAKKITDNEFTREKAIKEYSILKQFKIAHDIKDYTSKLGAIFSLTNGLGKDVSAINKTSADVNDLGLNLNNAEYKKYTEERINKGLPVIDVRDLFKDTWQGEYLKIFKEIKNKILPNVMLTQTQTFQDLYNKVILNTAIRKDDEKTLEKIRIDLLSYLTIKAYDQKLLTEDSKYAGSLSNAIIYPQLEGEKITEVVERLRKSNPNNFFLDSFVVLQKSNDEGNTTGLNLANANTFNNLSDSNKVNLQSSFAKLYGELETRADATKIIHYIMVKDGFSYGYASLLDALTPFTFETFLSQIDTAEVALRGRAEDGLFKQTFGFNYDEMVDDFIKGYLKNTNNKLNLKNNWGIGIYNPAVTNIDVQTSLYKNHIVSINTDTLYIFGDNEAENGKDGNRSIRDLGNTARIVYKKNLADTKSNYYTEAEFDNFIQTYEESLDALENLMGEYNKVVFPKYLIPESEIKNVKENSLAIFEYLQESLKNRFGYDLSGGKKVSKKVNKNVEKTEVFIDQSGDKARLKINTYPGQKITDTTDVMDLRKPNVDKQKKNTYKSLENKGFTPENIQIKGTTYLEVPVPLVRRINVETKEAPRYRYFVLDKYQSVVPKKMTASQLPTANYAEYIEFEPQGSRSQWAAGFMFAGNVPTSKEIRNFVKNSTDQDFDPTMNSDYDPGIKDNVEFAQSSRNAANAIKGGAGVEYDSESIKIGGKNLGNITEKDVEQIANDNNAEFIQREITDEDVNADNEAVTNLLKDQLDIPKETEYPTLTEFWDNNIQRNKENKAKLADNNINDLDDFIKAYENGIYENEETFIDQIKKCNL